MNGGRLRTVLAANGLVSALTALVGLLAAGAVADGLDVDTWLVVTGSLGLAAWAVAVGLLSRADGERLVAGTLGVIVGDLAWVAATPVVLAVTDPTRTTVVVAILIAVIVADLAVTQWWLRRPLASSGTAGAGVGQVVGAS